MEHAKTDLFDKQIHCKCKDFKSMTYPAR